MSIKYGHDDDRLATKYAMAHLVRGIKHPSQVIQVGDQIMTVGVDQGPLKDGVGSLDTRLRNIDQLPPAAQAIMNNAARHAVEQAGSKPVEEPIRKANSSDEPKGPFGTPVVGGKTFMNHIAANAHNPANPVYQDTIMHRMAEHGPGPHHADIHYVNQHGEEAIHHMKLGVDVKEMYKQDADQLRRVIPTLSGISSVAAGELLDRVNREPEDNGYDHVGVGLKRHRATGGLYVHGQSLGKTVLQPGEERNVRSSDKTLAKVSLSNKHMQSAKLRQFNMGSIKAMTVNGKHVIGGGLNKAHNLFESSLAKAKKPKLGSGGRFKELENKVGSAKLAAWIGRKKFGKKKFGKLSAKGKHHVAKSLIQSAKKQGKDSVVKSLNPSRDNYFQGKVPAGQAALIGNDRKVIDHLAAGRLDSKALAPTSEKLYHFPVAGKKDPFVVQRGNSYWCSKCTNAGRSATGETCRHINIVKMHQFGNE